MNNFDDYSTRRSDGHTHTGLVIMREYESKSRKWRNEPKQSPSDYALEGAI
jgi:hypothetical protein